MLTSSGIFTDVSLADYVADPCPTPSLSASLAHTLLTKSPRHCWTESARLNPASCCEEGTRLDIGTIAHACLLENDRTKVAVIEARDWRTKAAKEARDEMRALGRIPVLEADMVKIEAMVVEAKKVIADSELAEVFADGTPETTLVWQEEASILPEGLWCRSRPDWLTRDRKIMVDLKTTMASAEPSAWARGPLMNFGCDVQAALAVRGIHALAGIEDAQFIFFVQETDPPFACSMVGLSPAFFEFARDKLRRALTLWQACLFSDSWPGYPSRVAWVEPPEYAVYRWGESQL